MLKQTASASSPSTGMKPAAEFKVSEASSRGRRFDSGHGAIADRKTMHAAVVQKDVPAFAGEFSGSTRARMHWRQRCHPGQRVRGRAAAIGMRLRNWRVLRRRCCDRPTEKSVDPRGHPGGAAGLRSRPGSRRRSFRLRNTITELLSVKSAPGPAETKFVLARRWSAGQTRILGVCSSLDITW